MLDGIKNFLQLVNDNWTTILVIAGLAVAIWKKIQSYLAQTDEAKIEFAKKQISHVVLKMITDAETEYQQYAKAGEIKRSQVIKQIFADYPVLQKVVDQDELIRLIDTEINNALKTLREVIKETKKEEELSNGV